LYLRKGWQVITVWQIYTCQALVNVV
jgi:hypothetical protein